MATIRLLLLYSINFMGNVVAKLMLFFQVCVYIYRQDGKQKQVKKMKKKNKRAVDQIEVVKNASQNRYNYCCSSFIHRVWFQKEKIFSRVKTIIAKAPIRSESPVAVCSKQSIYFSQLNILISASCYS